MLERLKKNMENIPDEGLANVGYFLIIIGGLILAGIFAVFEDINTSNDIIIIVGFAFGVLLINCMLQAAMCVLLGRDKNVSKASRPNSPRQQKKDLWKDRKSIVELAKDGIEYHKKNNLPLPD